MKKSRLQHPVIRRLNHLWQAALAYFFTALFRALPLRAASAVGGWIGRHIGTRLGVSRRAWKNLAYVFPEKTDAEKKRIVREMWDNLGRNIAETPHVDKFKNLDRITLEGRHYFQDAIDSGKPLMMLSGHFGNWELALMIIRAFGVPVAGVYRRPNNPYVDKLIRWLRRDVALELFAKGPDGARGMLRWLKEGKSVGLLIDQKMNEGIELDFAGKPAMTTPAPVQMAMMTGALILTGYVVREPGCRFRMVVGPPIEIPAEGTRDEKVKIVTQKINDYFADHLRAQPGQWLWLHRRWVGV